VRDSIARDTLEPTEVESTEVSTHEMGKGGSQAIVWQECKEKISQFVVDRIAPVQNRKGRGARSVVCANEADGVVASMQHRMFLQVCTGMAPTAQSARARILLSDGFGRGWGPGKPQTVIPGSCPYVQAYHS
jgi:hypothetical protein